MEQREKGDTRKGKNHDKLQDRHVEKLIEGKGKKRKTGIDKNIGEDQRMKLKR